MRTIKFRGKCVHNSKYAGEWVTGGYVPPEADCKKQDEGLIIKYHGFESTTIYHVNPITVGQFTGLIDKNGKEIYEGDILALEGESMKLEVRFVRGVFAFLWDGDLDEEFPCNAPTQEWAEVIGNIHDNPLTPSNPPTP